MYAFSCACYMATSAYWWLNGYIAVLNLIFFHHHMFRREKTSFSGDLSNLSLCLLGPNWVICYTWNNCCGLLGLILGFQTCSCGKDNGIALDQTWAFLLSSWASQNRGGHIYKNHGIIRKEKQNNECWENYQQFPFWWRIA